jgi:peptidoglycan L-alanyl-D-glutamate endopeptidase CwlK
MKGIDNQLDMVFREAIKVSPIDFGIPGHGGLRTDGEQNELFVKGLSKCDGFEIRSNHQDGKALDFYAFVNGKASWRPHHLSMVAVAIMATANRLYSESEINIKLKWGGEFGSDELDGWDKPHIEIEE